MQLGYRPNQLARSFQARRSFLCGVMLEKSLSWQASDFLRGVQEVLDTVGMMPIYISHADDLEAARNMATLVETRQVDALIVSGSAGPQESVAQTIPVVQMFDYGPGDGKRIQIVPDVERFGREATRQMLALGHRRVALLTHEQYQKNPDARKIWEGYAAAMAEANLIPQVVAHSLACYRGDGRIFYWYHGAKEVLAQIFDRKPRPTAVVCYDTAHAYALAEEASRRGIPVPGELALSGMHDTELTGMSQPSLTSWEFPPMALGQAAAQAVLERLRGDSGPLVRRIPPICTIRDSTGP